MFAVQGNLMTKAKVTLKFNTTNDLEVPKKIVDQVIGQKKGVELIRKAAAQRRNVFLLGDPGTGKSMLGMAMAELLPVQKLQDILVYPNGKINDFFAPAQNQQ